MKRGKGKQGGRNQEGGGGGGGDRDDGGADHEKRLKIMEALADAVLGF
jgi:hypothetical protein